MVKLPHKIDIPELEAALSEGPLDWEQVAAPLATGELSARAGKLLIYRLPIGDGAAAWELLEERTGEPLSADLWNTIDPQALKGRIGPLRATVASSSLRLVSPLDFIGRGERVGVVVTGLTFNAASAREYFRLPDPEMSASVILADAPESLREFITKKVNSDRLWSWPEAVAWVETRSADVVIARRLVAAACRGDGGDDVASAAQMSVTASLRICDGEAALMDALLSGDGLVAEGRASPDGSSDPINAGKWRDAVVVCGRTADLCSAVRRSTVWAYDLAIDRCALVNAFPIPNAGQDLTAHQATAAVPEVALEPLNTGGRRKRVETRQQRALRTWLTHDTVAPTLSRLTQEQLYDIYRGRHGVEPLQETAFKRWFRRHREGTWWDFVQAAKAE